MNFYLENQNFNYFWPNPKMLTFKEQNLAKKLAQ